MGDHPSAGSGVTRRPFPEQIAFFRRKLGNRVPTKRWDDLTGAAHDSAFVVAGAIEADLLTDLAAAVDKAIAEGRGIEEFRRDFRAIVGRHGWTGWAGEGSVAGEAWRVKTILRTNAYASYSAGRYAQLIEGDFPFWVYRHGDSREPRLEHLSWDGVVLPPSHTFWQTHYPPSDWGCSCYALGARSASGAKRLGGDPAKRLPGNWQRIDPTTGEQIGIGKGWGYAPGASVAQAVRAAAGKIGSWDYQVAKAFMNSLPQADQDALSRAYRALPSTADDVRRYAARVYDPKPNLPELAPQRTLGMLPSDQATLIEQLTGRPASGYDYSVDVSAIKHIISSHGGPNEALRGQRSPTPADFALLPRILADPDRLTRAGVSEIGEQLISFTKAIDGETFIATMAVRGAKRKTVALKTFYIRAAAKVRK